MKKCCYIKDIFTRYKNRFSSFNILFLKKIKVLRINIKVRLPVEFVWNSRVAFELFVGYGSFVCWTTVTV